VVNRLSKKQYLHRHLTKTRLITHKHDYNQQQKADESDLCTFGNYTEYANLSTLTLYCWNIKSEKLGSRNLFETLTKYVSRTCTYATQNYYAISNFQSTRFVQNFTHLSHIRHT